MNLSRPNFFHHLHPPTIPAEQARWRYTLGAGGMAVFLSLVLLVTGILELYYYIPTPTDAALSVQTITYLVPFGGLIRNLHFWSAQLLIIVSAVHLLRVVFTGAYAAPRRFNYLIGLGLFVVLILLNFTGYILRWDQGIQWALIVGVNLVKTIPAVGNFLYRLITGADTPGAATLLRFYAWHIFGLMLPAGILIIWHVFQLRRDGGIAMPAPGMHSDTSRITRFELVRRETVAVLLLSTLLLLLAILVPAPIAPAIENITTIPGDSLAPWFFLWVQQMLKWGDPLLWGVFVPLIMLTILIIIPYGLPIPKNAELGRWLPKSNRLAQIILVVMASLVILLTLLGTRSN